MIVYRRLIIFIFLTNFNVLSCWTQEISNDASTDKISKIMIPKMEVLIASAIQHNAMVKFREKEVEAKEIDHKSWKKYWTRNFGIRGEGVYGTFNKFSSNESDITDQVNSIATVNQFNYNIGAYFRIPIEDILNQKRRVNKALVEIEQAKEFLEYEKQLITEKVIRIYQEFLLSQTSLDILTKNLENVEMQTWMIEKEYQNGILALNEYSRLKNIITNVKIEYEKGRSRFLTSKLELENLIGFKLN